MERRSSICRASPAQAPRSIATRACTMCSTRPAPITRSCSSRQPGSTAPRDFRSPMRLGPREAVKARNLKGIVIIGFDALPETLGKIRDGEITATIEQFPGKQSATGVDILTNFLKDGTKPAQQITLLTPVAITKDNLNTSERLNEVK